MCNFSKEDVLVLANAVLVDPLEGIDGDYATYIYCKYCDSELHGYEYSHKDFKHDVNCPVLIAQDLLCRS